MKLTLNLQSIKVFLKNPQTVIVLIIILAYILRVLPYLLGYSIPFTEDGIRDFQQVKYLVDNNAINFEGSYYNFGAFPVLHLLVYGISKFGFDPLKVFLFIPQILASLGILFFYLFLKKYFSTKLSLLACFLIAVFGPHIHWSAQPTRETIGLFLFPLIIYFFDREVTSQNIRKNVVNKIILTAILILMVFAHHWSSIMIIGWLLFYSWFFLKKRRNLLYALLIIGVFLILALTYWYFVFSTAFALIFSSFQFLGLIQLISGLLLLGGVFLLKKFDLNKIKNNWWRLFFLISISSFFIVLSAKVAPVYYPFQIRLMFLVFLAFIFIGFFYSKEQKINNIAVINIFYLIFWVVTIPYILNNWKLDGMPFDPFRTFEFAIFSLAPIAAAGIFLIYEKARFALPFLIIFLIILATLIYPPIFIYKNNFANTIFYDIRSDIRYISDDVFTLIKWANDRGYNVISPMPEIKSYQETFYPPQPESLILFTKSISLIKENYHYINDPIIKVSDPKYWISNTGKDSLNTVYSNQNGDFLAANNYNAEFVFRHTPVVVEPGETIHGYIIMRNIGSKAWSPAQDYQLRNNYDKVVNLPRPVLPGEGIKFILDFPLIIEQSVIDSVEEIIGGKTYYFLVDDIVWQMYKKDTGWFGEPTPARDFYIKF